MDRIRHFADLSVRRAAGLGLLAIALIVLMLHSDRSLSMHALAGLLTLEAVTLFELGRRAHRVPCQRRHVWALLEGKHGINENRLQRLISEVMRETFHAYARRLAGPALAAWVVDLGLQLSS